MNGFTETNIDRLQGLIEDFVAISEGKGRTIEFSAAEAGLLANALNVIMDMARNGQIVVGRAFHDGFMAGLDNERWAESSDFAALVGRDYAAGKPFPSTMPSGRLRIERDIMRGIIETVTQGVVREVNAAPPKWPNVSVAIVDHRKHPLREIIEQAIRNSPAGRAFDIGAIASDLASDILAEITMEPRNG